jgi:hypothetical protein
MSTGCLLDVGGGNFTFLLFASASVIANPAPGPELFPPVGITVRASLFQSGKMA